MRLGMDDRLLVAPAEQASFLVPLLACRAEHPRTDRTAVHPGSSSAVRSAASRSCDESAPLGDTPRRRPYRPCGAQSASQSLKAFLPPADSGTPLGLRTWRACAADFEIAIILALVPARLPGGSLLGGCANLPFMRQSAAGRPPKTPCSCRSTNQEFPLEPGRRYGRRLLHASPARTAPAQLRASFKRKATAGARCPQISASLHAAQQAGQRRWAFKNDSRATLQTIRRRCRRAGRPLGRPRLSPGGRGAQGVGRPQPATAIRPPPAGPRCGTTARWCVRDRPRRAMPIPR